MPRSWSPGPLLSRYQGPVRQSCKSRHHGNAATVPLYRRDAPCMLRPSTHVPMQCSSGAHCRQGPFLTPTPSNVVLSTGRQLATTQVRQSAITGTGLFRKTGETRRGQSGRHAVLIPSGQMVPSFTRARLHMPPGTQTYPDMLPYLRSSFLDSSAQSLNSTRKKCFRHVCRLTCQRTCSGVK